MSRTFRSSTRIITVLSLAAALSIAPAATAGCLKEAGDCLDCIMVGLQERAEDDLFTRLRFVEAELPDCEWELMTCVLFGIHHDYECGA